MAHRIVDNMLAFKGETPWHGLGVAVDPMMTGEQMLVAAKMAWKVERRRLAMRQADGTGLLTDPLAGFRAIVRQDTDEVFQVATDRYHPLQNADIVEFFREYCEAGHATMETVGAIDGGRKVWALARLNGGTATELAGHDELRGYMLLATSHDGSLRTVGKPTQVRVVCWNTLSASLNLTNGKLGKPQDNEFRMKHSRKWNSAVAAEARKVMGLASEQIIETNAVCDKLSRVSIDSKGRLEFVRRLIGGESLLEQVVDNSAPVRANGSGLLDSIVDRHTNQNASAVDSDDLGRLGKALLEAIVNSPGHDLASAENTLWGAVNGVTYHVDHERGRTQDTRLNGAWFGAGDTLKRQAVQVALDMSGVTV